MAEPFLAEIRAFSFGFAPRGWALCNGQLLPINQNQALFALLGTTYGGDGQVNFALPDLRGRVPLHFGDGISQGQRSGEETHLLAIAELPTHAHGVQGEGSSGTPRSPVPTARLLASSEPNEIYASNADPVALHPGSVVNAGSSQPHQNMQPFLTLSLCIALQGIFPSRN